MNDIKVSAPEVSVEATFTYRLTSAEPMQLKYGKLLFTPSVVTVTVVNGEITRVYVSGRRLLKNGRDGTELLINRYSWADPLIPEAFQSLARAAQSAARREGYVR